MNNLRRRSVNAVEHFLPEKSANGYWKKHDSFKKWATENEKSTYNEDVLLAYFEDKSKNLKSSTLWATYSMLKSTLKIEDNIDIGKFARLTAFLKHKHDGHVTKKSKTLEMYDSVTFINQAPNEDYLMIKTALIIGLCGACRSNELRDMRIQDVRDRGDVIVVTIPNTKTKKSRTFCVTEAYWIDIIQKYISLRPSTTIDRFFLFYSKNKCTRQPVGIHSFGSMPSKIATYLKLDNPKEYTGHCFRKSSATVLSGIGVEQNGSQPQPSTSTIVHQTSSTVQSTTVNTMEFQLVDKNLSNINVSHLEHCTINFNFHSK